jgi:hypothetical protein
LKEAITLRIDFAADARQRFLAISSDLVDLVQLHLK